MPYAVLSVDYIKLADVTNAPWGGDKVERILSSDGRSSLTFETGMIVRN